MENDQEHITQEDKTTRKGVIVQRVIDCYDMDKNVTYYRKVRNGYFAILLLLIFLTYLYHSSQDIVIFQPKVVIPYTLWLVGFAYNLRQGDKRKIPFTKFCFLDKKEIEAEQDEVFKHIQESGLKEEFEISEGATPRETIIEITETLLQSKVIAKEDTDYAQDIYMAKAMYLVTMYLRLIAIQILYEPSLIAQISIIILILIFVRQDMQKVEWAINADYTYVYSYPKK